MSATRAHKPVSSATFSAAKALFAGRIVICMLLLCVVHLHQLPMFLVCGSCIQPAWLAQLFPNSHSYMHSCLPSSSISSKPISSCCTAFTQARCVFISQLHLILEYVTNLLTCMMLEPSMFTSHDRGTLCLMQRYPSDAQPCE